MTVNRWLREERERERQRKIATLPRALSRGDWGVVACLLTVSLLFAALVYRQNGGMAALLGLLALYVPVGTIVVGMLMARRAGRR